MTGGMVEKIAESAPDQEESSGSTFDIVQGLTGLPDEGPTEKEVSDRSFFDDLSEQAPEEEPEAKKEQVVVETKDDDSGEESPGEEDISEEELAQYESALRQLRRAKTPQSVIDGLDREKILKWASDLEPVHSKNDTLYSEFDKLKKQLEEGVETDGGTSSNGTSESGTEPVAVTLTSESVTPLIESLGLESDERTTAAFLEFGQQVAKAALAQVEAPDLSEVMQLRKVVNTLMLKETRADLEDRFPEIEFDENTFNAVLGKYSSLMKTGDYSVADEALSDAAELVFKKLGLNSEKPVKPSPKPKKSQQPRTDTKPTPKPRQSKKDQDRVFFDWLNKNPGDIRGAQQAAGIEERI